ncbi:hypothetical protein ONS95_007164 [Cadophora gregata]|uniref:uncharacterized protein n=1 Tax=Cadophora gregata TaxID=51156 RepID=UPI0026DC8CE6|nr:uncharacterized protein ONS95_007164 [Cadophora gregata]KAK0100713.1 hypothetical protein ONS95_007164 [Cadophora gregata]KAK0117290.1 hypothetical protein ONS96_013123 [Cadophora gregata f. sp. sojae]
MALSGHQIVTVDGRSRSSLPRGTHKSFSECPGNHQRSFGVPNPDVDTLSSMSLKFPLVVGRRPFPTSSKGPMIKSSHQRLKLTYGQVNRLSKAKLRTLNAEKALTFHLFEKLPYELRCMIYSLMIPDRRVIEVKEPSSGRPGGNRRDFMLSYDFPAIMYISSEARQWAKIFFNYKRSFRKNLRGRAIYFDPARDSLLFHSLPLFEKFFGANFSSYSSPLRHQLVDQSKAIKAPLFLAINHAWELCLTPDTFKLLGQPRNIILARKSGPPGNMDGYAVRDIVRALGPRAKTASGQHVIPPKLVCRMTFKELRHRIEELNDLKG